MKPLRLRLPATSANLGAGFDTLGLAMGLYLEVQAAEAGEFRIDASGRDAEAVGSLQRNLMVETYQVLVGRSAPALRMTVRNEIPLGMGLGSSAAALLSGVMLANHFGELGMSREEVLWEACRREGHPDNVAACFCGGMTVSGVEAGRVSTATFGLELPWVLMIALPGKGLATSQARALLPDVYPRQDAVGNIQAAALTVAAYAQGRPELLAAGMRDLVHQPYRSAACPLLPLLEPLAGEGGVYSVTLSGAGPSVLLVIDPVSDVLQVTGRIRKAAGFESLEVLTVGIAHGAE